MTLSFEVLLLLGIAGFYLFDSAMLLYVNEIVYFKRRGKWRFVAPGSGWEILGKHLFFPHPFKPHVPIFRVCWSVHNTSPRQEEQKDVEDFLRRLVPLTYMTSVLFVLLAIVLPVILLSWGAGAGALLVFGGGYFTIIAMLIYVIRNRKALGLSGKDVGKLVFDGLACMPFALNMTRKITLRRSLAGDPVSFAGNAFDVDTYQELIGALRRQVDEELESVNEHKPRYDALKAYQSRLEKMGR